MKCAAGRDGLNGEIKVIQRRSTLNPIRNANPNLANEDPFCRPQARPALASVSQSTPFCGGKV